MVTPISAYTVEFQDVTFSYPGAERPAVGHISFHAGLGEVTAIIGGTGSSRIDRPLFPWYRVSRIAVDGPVRSTCPSRGSVAHNKGEEEMSWNPFASRGIPRALGAGVMVIAGMGALSGLPGQAAGRAGAAVAPVPAVTGHIALFSLHSPPTTSQCLGLFGIHCYQPFQFQKAYDLAPLFAKGINGSGRTIVIVDAFGSPTIANDLHAFDQAFGLPDPPSLQIIQPAGAVPPFDPNNSDMDGWAAETSLDVEWSHVMAPGAKILLVETPVSETEGVQGFPEIVQAENYVIDHNLGDVISQSFGATEETFPSPASILGLRSAFENAQAHNVSVLAASGDYGATNFQLNLTDLYTRPVNSWPSSDPLVTSVGGTMLTLDDAGNRLAPDVVWNDFDTVGGGAGGGGLSEVFDRPSFQNRVRGVVGDQRGTPDISMSAAVDGAVVFYHSFLPSDSQSARGPWHLVAGTSEASPLFAGIVALADQAAGQRLGLLNHRIYNLLARKSGTGIVDVTSGNNTLGPFTNSDGNTYTVQGFAAGPGYDLASGVGTVDAAQFVTALAGAGN
jgi:subtilase family serine protease